MPSSVTLKAAGLNTSPNQLETPEGSLSVASNVIIKRDAVVESRRGFKLYGTPFPSEEDRAKQLMTYRSRILRHYGDILQYDTQVLNQLNQSIFANFAGTYLEPQPGRRIRSIEANGNFYFTTSDGIKKISAKDATGFTTDPGFIVNAGGVKALDIQAFLKITPEDQSSFFTQDSVVAYRVVWGYNDANNNLILGTPSSSFQIYNPLQNLLIPDINRTLTALDNINQGSSLITDGNYFSTLSLTANSSPLDIKSNLVALTVKLDADIVIANGTGTGAGCKVAVGDITMSSTTAVVTPSAGTAPNLLLSIGDKINILTAITMSSGTIAAGQYTITNVTGTTFQFVILTSTPTGSNTSTSIIQSYTFENLTVPADPTIPATDAELLSYQTYLNQINTALQAQLSGIIPTALQNIYIQTLDITTTAQVELIIPIPQDINTNYFLQIYRTAVTQAVGTDVLSDLSAGDEMALVYEAYPTAAQLAAHQMIVIDDTPDSLRGANLYTNAVTGQGILQANDIPPLAKDINLFKNVVFYANTSTRQTESLSLLGVQQMITDYGNGIFPTLTIADTSGSSNTYTFVEGTQQVTQVVFVAESAGNYTGKYWTINSASNINQYYIWYFVNNAGTDPAPAGLIGIKVAINTAETAANIAIKTENAINTIIDDFSATITSPGTLQVINQAVGYTNDATDGTAPVTVTTPTPGTGELAAPQITTVTTVADVAGSLAGKYFILTGAFGRNPYYIWYRVSGSGTDPAIANKTGLEVDITTGASAAAVATATNAALNTLTAIFTSTLVSNTLTVTNFGYGPGGAVGAGTSGFTVAVSQTGALNVLLSTLVSPAQAIEQTSRSLIRVINANLNEILYGYYLSGLTTIPGQITFQARSLSVPQFYIVSNDANTGNSFSPTISPDFQITSISAANPTVITTSVPHGLEDGDTVVISNSNSTPNIDGYWTISNSSSTTFTIPVNVTSAGTQGSVTNTANMAVFSQNEVKPNRIYYSKLQQPEAVPLVNFFDVGAQDKEILRIFPLRDSLFVLKADGLFRISGEVAPFNLALFDSATICIAPDSVDVSNNLIFAWTTQGIKSISESGAQIISRPIDINILKLGSSNYPNFYTNTVGCGYESDFSYLVGTNVNPTDTSATIIYRYSSLTGTWTTFDRDITCSIVDPADDKMYLGAGDTNFIEQERKSFDRTDYADRELAMLLESKTDYILGGTQIKLPSIVNVNIGDIVYQQQFVSIYEFNSLLEKLDLDIGLTYKNYFSQLQAVNGDDLNDKLKDSDPTIGLAAKLVADPGTVTKTYLTNIAHYSGTISNISQASTTVITTSSPHNLITGRIVNISGTNSVPVIDNIYQITVLSSTTFSVPIAVTTPGNTGTYETLDGDFRDIQTCFNSIISTLNADTGVAFSNYLPNSTTSDYETAITAINPVTNIVTVSSIMPFIVGAITVYNRIFCTFTYSPTTMGDPLGLKHLRDATMMFENMAFTGATISFSTDLLPKFNDVSFNGLGPGLFGFDIFGNNYFGGGANSAPLRTYIPRDNQRCRYINVKFTHSIAREIFSIFGITITGEIGQSSRAYR